MLNQPTSSPMMKRIFGFLPLAAGGVVAVGSSALASSLPDGSGAVTAVPSGGVAVALSVLMAPLGLELVLASPPPDLAICDEQAIMPPIAERARQAATVVLSLNMRWSLLERIRVLEKQTTCAHPP